MLITPRIKTKYIGVSAARGAGTFTNCWNPLIKTGDKIGGVPTPNTLPPTDTEIFDFQIDVVTGVFILQMGSAGNEQIASAPIIKIMFSVGNIELAWDDVNLYYTETDQALALELDALVGQDVCFKQGKVVEYTYLVDDDDNFLIDEVGNYLIV